MHSSPHPPRWLGLAAVRSKAVVLLLLINCLMYVPLFGVVLCLPLFWYALLCDHSSFAIILRRKRMLLALLLLSYGCIVTVNILWQCVIVVCPDHKPIFAWVFSP